MLDNVMCDIETIGNESNSALLSISAVQFDLNTGEIGDKFHVDIDVQSCFDVGLKASGSTIYWWLQQSKEARDLIVNADDKYNLHEALIKFNHWLKDLNHKVDITEYKLWGNSARFDLGIIRDAIIATNTHKYLDWWSFWNERDTRTLVSFAPDIKKNWIRVGVDHNGIDDCLNQIGYCCEIWKTLNTNK